MSRSDSTGYCPLSAFIEPFQAIALVVRASKMGTRPGIKAGGRWFETFPRHPSKRWGLGVSENGGRYFPQLIMHDDDTDELEAALRGELLIFALFRHPEDYPGGLPIFGFRASPRHPLHFFECPMMLDPATLMLWSKQMFPMVGYRKQTSLTVKAMNCEEPEAVTEIQFVLHNYREDRVKVVRTIYLPVEMTALLHEYWMNDINFHAVARSYYDRLERFSGPQLVNLSRRWLFNGNNGHVEYTGSSLW